MEFIFDRSTDLLLFTQCVAGLCRLLHMSGNSDDAKRHAFPETLDENVLLRDDYGITLFTVNKVSPISRIPVCTADFSSFATNRFVPQINYVTSIGRK